MLGGSRRAEEDSASGADPLEIRLAGAPQTIEDEDADGVAIEIPLTGAPDDLLLEELKGSPPLSSLCESIEHRERSLVIRPNEGGLAALKTMLTAVLALIDTANQARAEAAMSDSERAAAAAEEQRREVQAELEAWWSEQGREPA